MSNVCAGSAWLWYALTRVAPEPASRLPSRAALRPLERRRPLRIGLQTHVRITQQPPPGRLPLASGRSPADRGRPSKRRCAKSGMALLEADVNFKVVKAFIDRVRDRAVDQEVLKSLTPAQQVVRIVRDEMLALFGDDRRRAAARRRRTPRVDPAARPAGLGQDDDVGQARAWLTKQGRHPLLVSTDVRRPAAIEQLSVVGEAGRRARCTIRPARWIRSRARRARWPRRRTAASTSSSSTPRGGCTSTTS